MATLVLHKYFNDQEVTLDSDAIKSMQRFSKEDDARLWGHVTDAAPYTEITLKPGHRTSENFGTAHVSETPEQIEQMRLQP